MNGRNDMSEASPPWFWLWLPVALWSVSVMGVVLYDLAGSCQ